MKIPELQENMFQLATEMERAGLVEEIVSDGLSLTDVRLRFCDDSTLKSIYSESCQGVGRACLADPLCKELR